MQHTDPRPAPALTSLSTADRPWRRWNLVGLTALTTYSAAVSWQAQQVSYPLYRKVGESDFAAYHQFYNGAIPLPVIVPGFACFIAAAAFPWTRPQDVSRPVAAAVAVAGIVSLASTVLWAIPMHARLDSAGPSPATIDSLLSANLVRSAALSVGAVTLTWCLGRLLSRTPNR